MTDSQRAAPLSEPPEAWPPLRRVALAVKRPVERFLRIQAASGLLLFFNAALALALANSPWATQFEALFTMPLGFQLGPIALSHSVRFWINDGLMAVFFFVVGLEIRRELHSGELSELRRAALPVCAALGGMLVPALIFFAINPAPPGRTGWATPMATDIAFAVGVLMLLGNRVPPALRIFLLAVAIIDDIGAVTVIALFYTPSFDWGGLFVALAGFAGIFVFQRIGLRRAIHYLPPSLVLWAGVLQMGVHPTLAGVLVGLVTPVRTWLEVDAFVTYAGERLEQFVVRAQGPHSHHDLAAPLHDLDVARREAVSPVERLQTLFNPWVAYGVVPLFALANAGVKIDAVAFGPVEWRVALGIGLGLVVGKGVGVLGASWLAVKLGIASLPAGIDLRGLLLVGGVAGIGFTMAIFISELAFPEGPMLSAAKLSVLVASALAAAGAYGFGILFMRPPAVPHAKSETEAEQSTAL